jgi:hypothetical protein
MTPVDLKYISLKHHRRIQLDSISVKMQTSAFVRTPTWSSTIIHKKKCCSTAASYGSVVHCTMSYNVRSGVILSSNRIKLQFVGRVKCYATTSLYLMREYNELIVK